MLHARRRKRSALCVLRLCVLPLRSGPQPWRTWRPWRLVFSSVFVVRFLCRFSGCRTTIATARGFWYNQHEDVEYPHGCLASSFPASPPPAFLWDAGLTSLSPSIPPRNRDRTTDGHRLVTNVELRFPNSAFPSLPAFICVYQWFSLLCRFSEYHWLVDYRLLCLIVLAGFFLTRQSSPAP